MAAAGRFEIVFVWPRAKPDGIDGFRVRLESCFFRNSAKMRPTLSKSARSPCSYEPGASGRTSRSGQYVTPQKYQQSAIILFGA
jgi:hypothetical protein